MLIYMGAPIDAHKDDPEENFKIMESCIKRAKSDYFYLDEFDFNINVFNPHGAFSKSVFPNKKVLIDDKNRDYDCKSIRSVNEYVIKNSDFSVFIVDNNVSYGVPYEIQYCHDIDKDAIILFNGGNVPMYLLGFTKSHRIKICFDEDEFVKLIANIIGYSLDFHDNIFKGTD